ncbi:MAG: primosomal protein N', partial [Bacteroidales bacterium]|nr:primosomal protein N' [Bacteroidales bacterium]
MRHTFFVDVLLPLHLPAYYTYRVPFDYNDSIQVGQRVVVQFGKKRIYSALVRRVHENVPPYPTKYILAILDIHPVITEMQFQFWEWMASYYMCYTGDLMASAFPTALKLTSESCIAVHPDYDGSYSDLSPNERKVLEALTHAGSLPIEQITDIVGFQKIMPLVQGMIDKGIIIMDEELKQRFVPKV